MSLFDDRDRESVDRDLFSEDEDVRRLAVERLGLLPLDEAVPRLGEALGDASWRVRKAAVERFVACTETLRVVEALIRALADGENPGRRNAALEALILCGARAVPALLDSLGSPDADVRKLVVDALAGIGDDRASAPLIRLLESGDPDANVRAAAADTLGAIGGGASEEALRRVAVNGVEDHLVRFSALHALAALEAPVRARDLAGLLDDPVLRPAALGLLGREADDREAFAALAKGLGSASRASREAAMRSLLRLLGSAGPERVGELEREIREVAQSSEDIVSSAVEHLVDADLPTRLTLIQFLGVLREPRAAVPILTAGRDEALEEVALATLEAMGGVAERAITLAWSGLDVDLRRNACTLFGRGRGERGAERLLAALEEPDSSLRAAAARAVGERSLVEALPRLVHALRRSAAEEDLESEDEMAALTDALIALARDDDAVTDRTVEHLRAHLEGAGESVRLAVARVLGRIGRRRDTQLVTMLLKDASDRVRRAAVDALARLEPGTDAEPLRLALADESPSVRIAAAEALGASESPAVIEDLRRLADDEEPRVRAAALDAVARRFLDAEDPSHRSVALALVGAALDDAVPVALAVLEALREVGGPIATRATCALGRAEPELVLEALRCLSAHAAGEALESLIPLVTHRDWSVRAEAIGALADRGVVRAVPAILRGLEMEQDEFVRDVILRALKRLEE